MGDSSLPDAWAGHVYTKKEFSVANTTFPHYGINNNITGKAQHIIKYAGSGVSCCQAPLFA
jgi:hypothetical protein